MKWILFICLFVCQSTSLFSQNDDCYQQLVKEGLEYKDSLQYDSAMVKFIAAKFCWDLPEPDSLSYYIDETLRIWINTLNNALATMESQNESLRALSNDLQIQRDAIQKEKNKVDSLMLLNYSNRVADKATENLNKDNLEKSFKMTFHAYDTLVRSGAKLLPVVSKNFGLVNFQYNAIEKKSEIGYINDIVMDSSSYYFLVIGDEKVHIWDINGNNISSNINHDGYIFTAVFAPNANTVLTASRDGTAKLWDLEDGLIINFDTHRQAVVKAEFSKDGKKILTASRDGTVKIWNLDGTMLGEMKHSSAIQDATFSKDGLFVLSRSMQELKYWEIDNRKNVQVFNHSSASIYRAILFEDDTKVITSSSDGKTRIWSTYGDILKSIKIDAEVYEIQVLSNAQKIILGCKNGEIVSWPSDQNNKNEKIEEEDFVDEIISSKSKGDDFFIAKRGNGHLTTWSNNASFKSIGERYKSLDLSKSGRQFLTISPDGKAKFWNQQGDLLMEMTGENTFFTKAVFTKNGQSIVLGTADGRIYITQPPKTAYELMVKEKRQPEIDRLLRKYIKSLFVNEELE